MLNNDYSKKTRHQQVERAHESVWQRAERNFDSRICTTAICAQQCVYF